MATLINGDGNAAVYAAQDSDWFAGVEGNTTKILKVGAKMEYEIEDANTIAIKNGVLITKEGRRVQIDAGAIDEFIIPTGTQGVTRYFIIGYHLYTDASSNQLCETFVQLMANGTDTIPEDTFRGGSTDVYVSLYRVKQDGITLDTIQSLLPEGVDLDGIGDEIDDIKDDIDQINSDLTELKTWTKVWDNSSPTSSFGEQTIPITDINKYTEFRVWVERTTTVGSPHVFVSLPNLVGVATSAFFTYYASNVMVMAARQFEVTATGIKVTAGGDGKQIANSNAVPVVIYAR